MRRQTVGVAVVVSLLAGCNVLLGNDPWTLAKGSEDGGNDGAADAFAGDDASSQPAGGDTSTPATTTGGDDATTEAAGPEAAPETGTGLNPLLVLPAAGPTCDPSQGDVVRRVRARRIATTTSGRCDGTTAGHEGTFPCSQDSDCDSTLQCFNGDCHVLCPLGSPCSGGCGASAFDVGKRRRGDLLPGGLEGPITITRILPLYAAFSRSPSFLDASARARATVRAGVRTSVP